MPSWLGNTWPFRGAGGPAAASSESGASSNVSEILGELKGQRGMLAASVLNALFRRLQIKMHVFSLQLQGTEKIIEDAVKDPLMSFNVLRGDKPVDEKSVAQILMEIAKHRWVCDAPCRESINKYASRFPDAYRVEGGVDDFVQRTKDAFAHGLEEEDKQGLKKLIKRGSRMLEEEVSACMRHWFELDEAQNQGDPGGKRYTFFEGALDEHEMARKILGELKIFKNNWIFFAQLFSGETYEFKDGDGHPVGRSLQRGEAIDKDEDPEAGEPSGSEGIPTETIQRVQEMLGNEREIEKKIEEAEAALRLKQEEDEAHRQDMDAAESENNALEERERRLQEELDKVRGEKKRNSVLEEELKKELENEEIVLAGHRHTLESLRQQLEAVREAEYKLTSGAAELMVRRDAEGLKRGESTSFSEKEGRLVAGSLGRGSVDESNTEEGPRRGGAGVIGEAGTPPPLAPQHPAAPIAKGGVERGPEQDPSGERDEIAEVVNGKFNELKPLPEAGVSPRREPGNVGDFTPRSSRNILKSPSKTPRSGRTDLTQKEMGELGIANVKDLSRSDFTSDISRQALVYSKGIWDSLKKSTLKLVHRYETRYMIYSMFRTKNRAIGISNAWYDTMKYLHESLKLAEPLAPRKSDLAGKPIPPPYAPFVKNLSVEGAATRTGFPDDTAEAEALNKALDDELYEKLYNTMSKMGYVHNDPENPTDTLLTNLLRKAELKVNSAELVSSQSSGQVARRKLAYTVPAGPKKRQDTDQMICLRCSCAIYHP